MQAPALFTPTPKAAQRVLEFFTAQINNDHTRRAYLNATRRFTAWCDARGLHELVQPFHVASFVKELQGTFTPPTVKGGRQQLGKRYTCHQQPAVFVSAHSRFRISTSIQIGEHTGFPSLPTGYGVVK